MAIVVEQQERRVNWFAIAVFLFLLAVIFGGGYFLFFAPTPAIELITPEPLHDAEALSQVTLDPASVINSPAFKNLRRYGTPPAGGNTGKQNPFQ